MLLREAEKQTQKARIEKEKAKQKKVTKEKEFLSKIKECYKIEVSKKLWQKEENERKIRAMEKLETELISQLNKGDQGLRTKTRMGEGSNTNSPYK